jgi:hypothetical protein
MMLNYLCSYFSTVKYSTNERTNERTNLAWGIGAVSYITVNESGLLYICQYVGFQTTYWCFRKYNKQLVGVGTSHLATLS